MQKGVQFQIRQIGRPDEDGERIKKAIIDFASVFTFNIRRFDPFWMRGGDLFLIKEKSFDPVGIVSDLVLDCYHLDKIIYVGRIADVRVTIPRRGTVSAAKDFASRSTGWLEQQFQRLAAQPKASAGWQIGTEILFRGEPVRIESDMDGSIRFGTERIKMTDSSTDLRRTSKNTCANWQRKNCPIASWNLPAHMASRCLAFRCETRNRDGVRAQGGGRSRSIGV